MTFKVTVTYKPHDQAPVMTKELTGVEKVERTWDKLQGKSFEVLRVYQSNHNWFTWGVGGILHISMIPEFK